MATRTTVINDPVGIHARPAAQFSQAVTAKEAKAEAKYLLKLIKDYDITLSKKFLGPEDKVLIVDDFLAVGKAMHGLLDVCKQAGATVGGIGIAIEKGLRFAIREGGRTVGSGVVIDINE